MSKKSKQHWRQFQRIRCILERTNQAKVMERWVGVDLNRDSGKEEGTSDLSPEGGEGADCGRGQGRSPGRDSHGPAALPRGPCRTRGDPASTCLLTKFLHLQPGALWGGGGGHTE